MQPISAKTFYEISGKDFLLQKSGPTEKEANTYQELQNLGADLNNDQMVTYDEYLRFCSLQDSSLKITEKNISLAAQLQYLKDCTFANETFTASPNILAGTTTKDLVFDGITISQGSRIINFIKGSLHEYTTNTPVSYYGYTFGPGSLLEFNTTTEKNLIRVIPSTSITLADGTVTMPRTSIYFTPNGTPRVFTPNTTYTDPITKLVFTGQQEVNYTTPKESTILYPYVFGQLFSDQHTPQENYLLSQHYWRNEFFLNTQNIKQGCLAEPTLIEKPKAKYIGVFILTTPKLIKHGRIAEDTTIQNYMIPAFSKLSTYPNGNLCIIIPSRAGTIAGKTYTTSDYLLFKADGTFDKVIPRNISDQDDEIVEQVFNDDPFTLRKIP